MSIVRDLISRILPAQRPPRAILPPPHPRAARAWEAASHDRLASTWLGDYGITATAVASALPTLRRRSREAVKNDPDAVRAVQIYVNNVVGNAGIAMRCDWQSRTRASALKTQDAVESAWRRWADDPSLCDASGRSSLSKLLQLCIADEVREGEALLQIIHDPRNPFGISLLRLRADALAVDKTDARRNIYNGVELNQYKRAVAYHIYTQCNPEGQYYGATTRVPADEILHLYREEYAGQTRGIPLFASVLRTLHMAHAYDEAELVAARIDACRHGIYKPTATADPFSQAETIEGNMFQPLEAGEDLILGQGWDYQTSAPSRPNAQYAAYRKAVMRQVASGLNVPYNTLCNDLEGVSYSSIRAGTLEDREAYKILQQDLIDSILRPLYRRRNGWLNSALANNALSLPPTAVESIRTADTWLPRRWQWIDPESDARANEIAADRGWTTDSAIAAEQGRDYWANIVTKAEESEWQAQHPSSATGDKNNGNQ